MRVALTRPALRENALADTLSREHSLREIQRAARE